MSSQTSGDLKLIKPAVTDNINQTIDVDLPANFEKIDEEVTNRVKKEAGKELSTNDYTTEEKNKLKDVAAGATKVEDSATNGNIKINGQEIEVYDDTEVMSELSNLATQSLNIKNVITNGDFSNGIVGWEPYAGTLSVVDNKLDIVGNGTGQHIRVQQQTAISSQVGNKIYVKSSITLNNTADQVMCQVSGNIGNAVSVFQLFNVKSGIYEFSGIVELPANFVGNLRIQFWHYYADSATANEKVMSVGKTTMIDLTKVFGLGNEFSKDDMDALMVLTNGWFDGKLRTNQILNWLKIISETEIDHKVDKESGKGLSTNDYTDLDKLQVAEIPQIKNTLNSLEIGEFGSGFVDNNMLSSEVKESMSIKRPQNIITLIGGQDDEVPKPALSLNTVESDLVNYKIGDRGWKVNIIGNTGHQVDFEPESGAWSFPPICAIGAWIYIEDSTKISNLRINFYNDSAKTIISSYPAEMYGFKTGWNLFRWSVDYPNTKLEFSSIYRIRLTGDTTDATSYTIGHIWAECSEKAQILFIHDGGYRDFYLNGYPDLKARNIPVTWGLIPNRINTGDVAFLTPLQADILSKENNNSMSFHSWNLDVLNNFNASQLRAETMKCLKWLKRKGYTGGVFRSAFTQNLAPEHAAIRNLVLAYRRVSNGTTNTLTCYPFPNRYDIDMIRLHQFNSNLQGLTDLFASMKKYRTLMVGYTHMVNVAGNTDMTPELWNHFLDQIDIGIAEGWLEGVTFETLIARSGVKFKRGLGDTVIEIYDEVGELKKIRLP